MNHAPVAAALNVAVIKKFVEHMRMCSKEQQSLKSLPVNKAAPSPLNNAALPTMHQTPPNPIMAALVATIARVMTSDSTKPSSKPMHVSDIPIIASVAAAAASIVTPFTAIIVQVHHIGLNQTHYFQLADDITLEALVKGLRMSFDDNNILANLLFYKRMNNTWQCLVNPSGGDYLKTMLLQAHDTKLPLQMKVIREQDPSPLGNVH
ncbi:hypothetical protein LRAMOSA02351 [Lichtheimia ramosa]|uniref:Uncharacterized protein n=1 Tax=Lichtheimia ramosa TaxID=688394 RepID=A0A077WR66_9FUNG|nr:hypothetical protein LRAMOSA02351 [Lichtheimia ramosa]